MAHRTFYATLLASLWWCALVGHLHAQSVAQSYAELQYANDFFTTTDRYYTQGVRLAHAADVWGRVPTARLLVKLNAEPAPFYSAFLQQDCYTPSSIRSDTILLGDRPFAAALYFGHEVVSYDPAKGQRLRSRFIGGLIGPCAFCAEEQRWIHNGIGAAEPRGWQYQVRTGLILNYGMEAAQLLVNGGWYRVEGIGALQAGTYRDALSTAVRLELGSPLAVDHGRIRTKKVRFNAHAQADATAVAYDAALQGGLLQQEGNYALRAPEIERLVLAYGWGARLSIHKVDLSYEERYIGRTFKSGLTHGWGTIAVRVWW